MEILISDEQNICKIDCEQIKSQLSEVLSALELDDCELSLLLTDDPHIQQLNRDFRNIDSATDVLSFPQYDESDDETERYLLGDVAVSLETAQRQAPEHALELNEEVILLIIHGILHLLGYDHERSVEEEETMRNKTRELFQRVFPGKQPSLNCGY
ncbi:MAG: rRNA maturation RNase YbeY [Candidatus Nitrohelix vancouverensis]|uniref:Endoribonuclease YbeY n=1 Tax=Candidatus Nitrohelix vancouverensis TaxID=2705534 RepID=A0A7T0C2U0_9BACT|nr:MAG: rRNA maturation RNase YbeY [Candidatus Nitrohelix vancouverensis]